MSKDAGRLVLVVEDDVSVRRPLVKFLEMHGFAVVTAETSDEGLDALKKNRLVAAVVQLWLGRGTRPAVVAAGAADRAGVPFSGGAVGAGALQPAPPRPPPVAKTG